MSERSPASPLAAVSSKTSAASAGEPSAKDAFLPYGRQWLDDEDIAQVVEVLRGDFLTTGPLVADFEQALCGASGAKHAVVLNSGTSALHAAYAAAGLQAGDNIITSPLTFAATANAAQYLGAEVRFVDVCEDTGNLDPEALEAAITPQTKLIVPVDYAGHPADYDAIMPIAEAHGLRVIADAAHSLGASYKGRPVGTLAHASEVSFHPVKPITTAEGGAVLSNDAALAKAAALFRSHGISKDPADMERYEGPWYYEMQALGYNYRLTDVQCALGLSQLHKLESFIARRRAIAQHYHEAFADLEAIRLPSEREGVASGWHLYVIRVNGAAEKRKTLFERLRTEGLGVQVHYVPVHYHPYYQRLGYQRGAYPLAEDFYARAISLPIYPQMDDDAQQSSIERVRRAVQDVL